MSTRAMRKLQGGRGEPDLPQNCLEEEEQEGEEAEQESQDTEDGQLLESKRVNRFDLLLQGSPSESEVKEDDDMSENFEVRDDGQREGASPQPPHGTGGVRKKRKKKRKRGRPRVPASSEDPTDNDKDDIDNIIEEVNAISGEGHQQVTVEKSTNDKVTRNLLTVEHKYLNPQNEMRRIFGSRVVQASEQNRRRGRVSKMGRSTWIVQGHPNWAQHPRPGISMSVAETRGPHHLFKFNHSLAYQQVQFKFLEAVESFNPENIMVLLNHEPFHVDTLLQVSEIFRLGDDSATAAQLIERAIYVLESASHPLFNIATGTCRLQYRQQENRGFFIALFRHILNVGQKGCHRTALELCKLLLNMSPDDDPLAVSLMLDFYAIRAQEYAWLVALYDLYEPTKNLSMLPSFAFSVPLALFHLCVDAEPTTTRDKRECTKTAALVGELGGPEEMRARADSMVQRALIMFPGVLLPLLDKCSVQPDPVVAAHSFFGPTAQTEMSKGLAQIVNLYVGRCYHLWKEAGVMSWLEDNVSVVLGRVDSGDPVVKEAAEVRQMRYKGTPLAIYRHILMSEIKDATATLPPSLANTPVMSYDPLPPPDTICGYKRPPSHSQTSPNSSSILATFFRSLLPNYDPNAPDSPTPGEDGRAEEGVEGEDEEGATGEVRGVGDLRASVNSLLDAMRDLLSNIHLPEPPGNEADRSEEENDEWD